MPELIRPDWPAPANVQAFTTTRHGGVSEGPWHSWNLGERCGDDPRHVRSNREILRELLPGEPQWLRQVHGNRVVEWGEDTEPEADAIVSRKPGQVCAVLTADCLPLLFCNKAGTEVAACHAGWRGLAAGVIQATVAAMQSHPNEIMAWLGPAIGPEAYEVGDEVYEAFTNLDTENARAFKAHNDRWLADLYQLARLALGRAGVPNIAGGEHCTYLESNKFFSYRRDGQTGRMTSAVWMAKRAHSA
jgi:YfiH family protein